MSSESDSENSRLKNKRHNSDSAEVALPQKKFYRQRAHSNPLNDHSFI